MGTLDAAPVQTPVPTLVVNPPESGANVQVQGPVQVVESGEVIQLEKTKSDPGYAAFSLGTISFAFRIENVNALVQVPAGKAVYALIRTVGPIEEGGLLHNKRVPLQLQSSANGVDTYVANEEIPLYAPAGHHVEFFAGLSDGAQDEVSVFASITARRFE